MPAGEHGGAGREPRETVADRGDSLLQPRGFGGEPAVGADEPLGAFGEPPGERAEPLQFVDPGDQPRRDLLRFAGVFHQPSLQRRQFGGQPGVAFGVGLAGGRVGAAHRGRRLADRGQRRRVVGVALADGHRVELRQRRLQLFVGDGRRALADRAPFRAPCR